MAQHQSSITPFLISPPNVPPNEDSIQPVRKKKKISRKKTSWIWEHFIEGHTDNDEPAIICQVEKENGTKCNVKLKHDSSGISHLWSIHKMTNNGKQPDKQQKLNVTEKYSEAQQDRLRQFLVNWVIDDLQPFSVVNSPSFRIFCNELDPAFLIPEAKSVKAMIHQAYNFTYPRMIEQIGKEAKSVALTADLWTGRNHKGFLGITCSYLDADFILKEVILAIEYVRYPHTAEHIAECFENILKQWNIRHITTTITTDNGSNMKNSVELLNGISWIGCFAHTLQLVVGKGLYVAKTLILRVERLIDFFMTTKQSKRLEKIQKEHPSLANNEEGDEPIDAAKTSKYLNAIADVSTRWYSSYLAWRHLTKLKGYIKGLVNHLELESDPDSRKDAKLLKNIMISDDEWSLILDLTEILSHFADATNYLGESKYCTYSSMNPTIIEIMKWVRPSSSNNGLTDIDVDRINDAFGEVSELEKDREINTPVDTYDLLDQIKKILYGALIHYFNPTSSEALLAALLDPRFKNLHLFTQNQKQDAIDELQNRYSKMKLEQSTTSTTPPAQPRKKRSLFYAFTKSSTSTAENEVNEYLALDEIPFESDPYAWCNDRKEKFPVLSQLARKKLGIRVASTPSERLFSDVGNLLTVERTRMKPELFSRVMFLKRNGHHFSSIHPHLKK
ncbi:zinc finger BED domain-containing protein 4-like [Rhizophagus irregularis DAOM 181602=DAOM 197198]|uniref:HAT C-terminal dimerisation domain-containing protein n=2 Tax=Rhizophagus irregularis TaxID=588596 RepID=A0A015MKM5_RHIIW|nr:hypothetical protein RirG_114720 [Rhizophagus irregularis DAOM 197198w]GBC27023.1 zinc finger BED domain-containing protein 4-like [Rhizophagus irregularis DAOM 181602=DAOM 197198]